MNTQQNHCPDCKLPIPTSPGPCTRCVMQGAQASAPPTPPLPAELRVAALQPLFEEYEIKELLGRGGMGVVYRAFDPKLARSVALKILLPELSEDPQFASRFAREAQAMARLAHPHVVGIHDFGERSACYFLVMEYVEGPNLRQLLLEGGLGHEDVMRLIPQVGEALQFAHARGVVHRDIKPENILVDEELRVRITDFGLAKLGGAGSEAPELTRSEQVFGTPHYMAPEQVRGTRDVDGRADIYSLGVVLYELLTGKLPIGNFDAPSRVSEVPARFDPICRKALASDPAQRYQSARELQAALDKARTPGSAAPNPDPNPELTRWTRLDLMLGGGERPSRKDLAWFGGYASTLVILCMFFPWFHGIHSMYGLSSNWVSPGTTAVSTGWKLWHHALPVVMLVPTVLTCAVLMVLRVFSSWISSRITVAVAGFACLQVVALFFTLIDGRHEIFLAPVGALLATGFLVWINLLKTRD